MWLLKFLTLEHPFWGCSIGVIERLFDFFITYGWRAARQTMALGQVLDRETGCPLAAGRVLWSWELSRFLLPSHNDGNGGKNGRDAGPGRRLPGGPLGGGHPQA